MYRVQGLGFRALVVQSHNNSVPGSCVMNCSAGFAQLRDFWVLGPFYRNNDIGAI